jgi:hypothetical protein
MTAHNFTGNACWETASIMACKLLPEPEMRTTVGMGCAFVVFLVVSSVDFFNDCEKGALETDIPKTASIYTIST